MGRVRGVRCCSRLTRHGVQQMAGRHWARAANAKSYSRLSELFSQCQWHCHWPVARPTLATHDPGQCSMAWWPLDLTVSEETRKVLG